jgi:hypothetical protein
MLEQKPFFGTWNEENKAFWVATMQDHQDHDRLISGSWFEEGENGEFKGCFFGCAMQTDASPLEKAISAMGLPDWLIYLAEKIYEGLPNDERLAFPVKLLESIPVSVNLEPIKHKLAIVRLTKLASENAGVSECINTVIELHKLELIGKSPCNDDWSAAWSAAWSARSAWSAESAARSAESAAWSAAWSARSAESAESAARSAESAAWSAAWSARSAESAWSAAWSAESENLIELLSESMQC